MKKVCALGEILFDIIEKDGKVNKYLGGAIANVAGCIKALGGRAQIFAAIGKDQLGEELLKKILKMDFESNFGLFLAEKPTMYTFVRHDEKNNRSFDFFRTNTADMYYPKSKITKDYIEKGDVLHIGSLAYVKRTKQAINKAIKIAKLNHALVSFDANIRLSLFKNQHILRKNILKLIKSTNILKVSDDEVEFITKKPLKEGIDTLRKKVDLLIVTRAEKGSSAYILDKEYHCKAKPTKVVDTTGAGDAFIGAFLYLLLKEEKTIYDIDYPRYLNFASKVASIVVAHLGAMGGFDKLKKAQD